MVEPDHLEPVRFGVGADEVVEPEQLKAGKWSVIIIGLVVITRTHDDGFSVVIAVGGGYGNSSAGSVLMQHSGDTWPDVIGGWSGYYWEVKLGMPAICCVCVWDSHEMKDEDEGRR